MAFSKSKFKRFNETMSCAPPVGSYDLSLNHRSMIGAFDKSTRFKIPKEPLNHNSILRPSMSMDSLLVEKTPVKLFEKGVVKSSVKVKKNCIPHQPDLNRKIAELEKEIKNLLLHRTEQDKLLMKNQEEMKKLDGRLHATLQEKSSLEASLAAKEKELCSIRKAKDVLMNKVDSIESSSLKKHEDLQSQIQEAANKLKHTKEMSRLQDELTCQVRHLEADLEEAASKILALKETKSMQEKLTKDSQKYCEEIELQIIQLQDIINKVRAENTHVKQQLEDTTSKNEIFSTENSELKKELAKTHEMLKQKSEEDEILSKRLIETEKLIKELEQSTINAESKIKTQLEEITSSQINLSKETARANHADNQVVIISEKLENMENMMNENLKSLSAKYQLLEVDYTTCQTARKQETDQLRFELDAIHSTSAELESERNKLQKQNVEITESVEKHKEIGIKLEQQLVVAEQEIEISRREFDKYKEEAENDHLVLSETKNSLLKLSSELEEKIASLNEENKLLQMDLSRHAETFEEMTRDKTVLLNKMTDLSIQKQGLLESKQTLLQESDIKDEQLKKLQEDLVTLKKEKEMAYESKMKLEKEMDKQLDNARDELQKVKDEFGKRLVDTQMKCSSKEAEIEKLSSQVESLEKSLQSTCNESLKLQETIEKMEEQKSALNDKIVVMENNHQSDITHRDTEIENLSTNLKQTQEEKNEIEQKKKEYKEMMECKIKKLEDTIKTMQVEFGDQYSLMEAKYSTAESEVERLGSHIKTLEDNLQSTSNKGQKLQEEINELEEEKCALNHNLADLEHSHLSDITHRDTEIETLSINLKQTQEEKKEIEQKMKEHEEMMECKIKQLEDTIKTMQVEFEDQYSLMEAKCSTAESEVQRLGSHIKTLEDNLQSTSNKGQKLQEEINELEEEKCALNNRLADLEHSHLSDITHRDTEFETLSTNLKQTQKEKQEMEKKKKEYEEMVECEIKQLEDINKKMQEEFEEEYSLMQNKYTEAESEVQRLNQQIHTLEENIENAIQDHNRVQHHAQEMEQENSALCQRIDNMKETIDSNHTEFEKEKKIYQEKLNNMEKELIEIEETKNLIVEDMQTKLNETQTVKVKYENRIATLQEHTEETEEHAQRLEERISHLEHHIEAEKENTKQLVKNNQKLCDERSGLTYKMSHLEANNTSLSEAVEMWSSRFQELNAEKQELSERINEVENENHELSDRISHLQEAAHNHVCNEENNEAFEEEILKWQNLYEDLQEKVAPFKEQLDQFELERKFLLCKSSQAQSEIQQLSDDYAKLLGHQNTKQKIQHVQKLKKENLTLKEEVSKLREQNVKYLRQMKTAADRNPTRKRFNPSEAFKNTKENKLPLGTHN